MPPARHDRESNALTCSMTTITFRSANLILLLPHFASICHCLHCFQQIMIYRKTRDERIREKERRVKELQRSRPSVQLRRHAADNQKESTDSPSICLEPLSDEDERVCCSFPAYVHAPDKVKLLPYPRAPRCLAESERDIQVKERSGRNSLRAQICSEIIFNHAHVPQGHTIVEARAMAQ